MTWRERIEDWLVPEEVKQAIQKNEEAHRKLRKAMDETAPGLRGVDALLKGERDHAAA